MARDTVRGQSGITVLLCLLVATFEGIDLQAAGLAVPQLRVEFGLEPGMIGWFTAASSIGVLIGALSGGRIADRIGRRWTLLVAVGIFGLASIATALSNGFAMLFLTRLATGIGLGAALPNLVALANENSPPNWKSRAVAIMYAGFPLGGALASGIMSSVATPGSGVNALVEMVGLTAGDWRVIFYIGGFAPLLAIPIIVWFLPDSLEFSRLKSAASGAPASWGNVVFGEGRALNSILLWISFFTTLLVLYLLLNWLPTLLRSRDFGLSETFLVQLVFNLGGIPGSILVGMLMDSGRRRTAVSLAYGGLVVMLAAISMMPTDLAIALVCGTLLGVAVMGTQGLLYGLAPANYHTAIRGTGVGTAVFVGRVGSVVGPLVAAGLVGAGRSAPQVLMALVPLALIGGVTAIWLVGRVRSALPQGEGTKT